MSIEENKAAMRRVFEESLNKGNLEVIPELIAPDYKFRSPLGMEARGPEGFKQVVIAFRTAFPDLHLEIHDIFAEGDMVGIRHTMSGTFQGEMMGMPPTGKHFSLPGAILAKMAGGKEQEAFSFFDVLSFYRQLGVATP